MRAEDSLALPPCNIEAELGVLGSVLLDEEAMDEVAPILAPDDFYRDSHQVIYRALRDFHAAGRRIDLITLNEELTRRGLFEEVGGDGTLAQIMDAVPHAANARYYAQIVKQKSISRQLIEHAYRVIKDNRSNTFDSDELMARAASDLARIEDGGRAREPVTIAQAARESLRRFDVRAEGELAGCSSGLEALDKKTGGFRGSQLIIIAARPGMGKSALALNIAEHAAGFSNVPTLYISMEMGSAELGDRAVCGKVGIGSTAYREATEVRSKREHMARRVEEFEGLPVYFDDTPSQTPAQVASLARRMRRKRGVGLVIVDYLQLMSGDDRKDKEYDVATKASKALKGLAMSLDIPVIALSQLNRDVEKRTDKHPLLSDLRATGQIEQDADLILFLYRGEYYDKSLSPCLAEVDVAKQRNGSTGRVEVAWDGPLMRFGNIGPRLAPGDDYDPALDNPF